jgi:hypothetical protein
LRGDVADSAGLPLCYRGDTGVIRSPRTLWEEVITENSPKGVTTLLTCGAVGFRPRDQRRLGGVE